MILNPIRKIKYWKLEKFLEKDDKVANSMIAAKEQDGASAYSSFLKEGAAKKY